MTKEDCSCFETVALIILAFTKEQFITEFNPDHKYAYIDTPAPTSSINQYNSQTDGCGSSNAPNHDDESQIYHYVDSSRFSEQLSLKHGADPVDRKATIYHIADTYGSGNITCLPVNNVSYKSSMQGPKDQTASTEGSTQSGGFQQDHHAVESAGAASGVNHETENIYHLVEKMETDSF